MTIESFSAKRLDDLLKSVTASDAVGLDTLRDIAAHARAILGEVDDPARRVVAWVLMKQMDATCDRYDGDPMTVEASSRIAQTLRTSVRDALVFLNGTDPDAGSLSLQLASRLVDLDSRWR